MSKRNIRQGTNNVTVEVIMTCKQKDYIDGVAKQHKESRSKFIRDLIERHEDQNTNDDYT